MKATGDCDDVAATRARRCRSVVPPPRRRRVETIRRRRTDALSAVLAAAAAAATALAYKRMPRARATTRQVCGVRSVLRVASLNVVCGVWCVVCVLLLFGDVWARLRLRSGRRRRGAG